MSRVGDGSRINLSGIMSSGRTTLRGVFTPNAGQRGARIPRGTNRTGCQLACAATAVPPPNVPLAHRVSEISPRRLLSLLARVFGF